MMPGRGVHERGTTIKNPVRNSLPPLFPDRAKSIQSRSTFGNLGFGRLFCNILSHIASAIIADSPRPSGGTRIPELMHQRSRCLRPSPANGACLPCLRKTQPSSLALSSSKRVNIGFDDAGQARVVLLGCCPFAALAFRECATGIILDQDCVMADRTLRNAHLRPQPGLVVFD